MAMTETDINRSAQALLDIFSLRPESPLVDATGWPSDPESEFDLDGIPRPQGEFMDPGAYETIPPPAAIGPSWLRYR